MTRKEMIEILKETIDNNYDHDYNVGIMYDYESILNNLQSKGLIITEQEFNQNEFRKLGER